ncbi:hypothetical protein EMIT047CA2_80235 [Pseudomonas soli]
MSLAIILESLCQSVDTVRILAIPRLATSGEYLRMIQAKHLLIFIKIIYFMHLEKVYHWKRH